MNGRGRGGMGTRGSRGGRGGMYNMNGRGGGPSQGGSFRAHGSGRGFGNRDNRRGGSFTGGGAPYHSHNQQQQQQQQQGPSQQNQHQQIQHQQIQQQNYSGSFRARHQNFSRGARHDSGIPHGPKDMFTSSGLSSGKKDENRRTLTDFKIVGLSIADLGWGWGNVPVGAPPSQADVKQEVEEARVPQSEQHDAADQKPEIASASIHASSSADADAPTSATQPVSVDGAAIKSEGSATVLPPPPSRIRIYFHTPVTADDAHPIMSQGSYSGAQGSESAVRKGKRKKLEDDDGDSEDGRGAPPPPPQHSSFEYDGSSTVLSAEHEGGDASASRGSVAPSVAETVSEGDWLMAAIGEDEGEGDEVTDAPVVEADILHDIDADGEPDDLEDGKLHFRLFFIYDMWTRHSTEMNTSPLMLVFS